MTEDQHEIERLRSAIAELEANTRILEAQLADYQERNALTHVREALGIGGVRGRMLLRFIGAAPECVSDIELLNMMGPAGVADTLKVHLSRLRAALARHKVFDAVVNHRGRGYAMRLAAARQLQALLWGGHD